MSKVPQESATNLDQVKAEMEEGLHSARMLVDRTRFLLSGDGTSGEAKQA